MTPSRPSRLRRTLAGIAALGLALVAGGGIVVFGAAAPASAAPVFIVTPTEPTPITSGTWPFVGTATPGDNVRVGLVGGPQCNTVADGGGNWNCNVTFPASGQNLSVQAISIPHTGPGQVEDTKEYTVAIEPTIDENTDSAVRSRESVDPALTGHAAPNAIIQGAVNGTPCNTVADAAGAYTCTATGAFLPADGTYMLNTYTQQQPPGFGFFSNQKTTWYELDTAVTVPDASVPFDTNTTHANYITTDNTPTVSGANGTAEDNSNVIVYMYEYSTNGTVPPWPALPPNAFGSQYCTVESTSNGAWSCSGSQLHRGSVYVFGLSQIDLAGNGPPSPDSEFSIQIDPLPGTPAILEPEAGYHSLDPVVHISTQQNPGMIMYVREGTTNLCPVVLVPGTAYQCNTTPLSNGYHTIRVYAQDSYGTFSAVATRVVHIGPYPVIAKIMPKLFDFVFHIIGPDGVEVGPDGLQSGDAITILASGLPPGTTISAEIHSTPIALGGATIGPDGLLNLATTIPEIESGDHEVVVSAEAPGYTADSVASPLVVRDKKVIGDPATEPTTPDPEKGANPVGHHPAVGPGGGGAPNAHGFTDPTVFGSSVASPFDASAHVFALTVGGIVLSGSIALVFLAFVGFPAELLESTIRSNYDRAFGWIGRLRRRVHRLLEPIARVLSNQWVATTLSVLAAAFVLGFADPDFGFNGSSVRLFLAMIISVATINVGLSLIVMRVARKAFDVSSVLKPMPAAIAIVAISVLVSRLLGISPGFLFGIVLGVQYARELRLRDEARLGVLGVGLTIAAGVLAWLGYGLASLASGPGFFNNLAIETLAAITLEALGTLVVAMLPIEFLDGKTIFRWSKLAWAGLYVVTLLVFLFVVVPLSDNWGVMSAPIFGFGTLFVVFAVVSVVTWAIFQRRPRSSASSREGAAPRRRSRR